MCYCKIYNVVSYRSVLSTFLGNIFISIMLICVSWKNICLLTTYSADIGLRISLSDAGTTSAKRVFIGCMGQKNIHPALELLVF